MLVVSLEELPICGRGGDVWRFGVFFRLIFG